MKIIIYILPTCRNRLNGNTIGFVRCWLDTCFEQTDFHIITVVEKGDFDVFQQIIAEADAFLTFQQRQKLHALERNFCAARLNAGQQDYLPKLARLLKTHKKNKTNSLPPHVFDLNNNFVNMVMQLLNTIKGDKERVETMLDKIKSSRVYGEREWLLEKWAQLL